MDLGFTKNKLNSNLYFKVEGGIPVMLLLYVDDLFLTGVDGLITDTNKKLDALFEMKDLVMMHYILHMEVWQNTDGISLGQGKYVVEILKRFKMMECKAMATPMALNLKLLSDASSKTVDTMMYRQMIGSLMYLRPNIWFVVNTLRHVHLMVAKHAGVQFIGSSTMRIRRLTWRVMLIQIGQAVPSTGRVLRDVASVWDQV